MARLAHFLAFFFILAHAASVHGQAPDAALIKAKVISDWERISQDVRTARWERRTEYFTWQAATGYTPHSVDSSRRAFSRSDGSLFFLDAHYLDRNKNAKKDYGYHYIANSHYAAELKKNKDGAGWALAKLTNGKTERDKAASLFNVPCPWMIVGNRPFLHWISDAGFVFTRTELVQGKESALRAHFTYTATVRDGADSVKSGYVDFEPNRHHRPVAYSYQSSGPDFDEKMQGTLEYDTAEGISALIGTKDEIEHRVKGGETKKAKEITTIANLAYNANISGDEFRLTFYGITEPTGVVWDKPSSKWWLWFIVVGVLSLAVGAYFRRRLKRSGTEASRSPSGQLKSGSSGECVQ